MPTEWPPPREKWFPGFTASSKGRCWVRTYKGRALTCGGVRATRDEVERTFASKRDAIDKGDRYAAVLAGQRTYRQAMAEFLEVTKARIGANRNRIEERTYDNYVTELNNFGNFVHDGTKTADRDVRDVGPAVFSAYARTFADWKASGFDSVVCRVGAMFRWAEGQEYIDRYRPGPEFKRPAKQDIRDQRIDLAKSFAPAEVAGLWDMASAGSFLRCAVGLGVCAAFTNSDLGHVSRQVMDLAAGVIDFRRRKTGKVRRIIPIPADVLRELRAYVRPEPAKPEWADHFFLTTMGRPYTCGENRKGQRKPSNTVSRLFRELMVDADVTLVEGRNFTGLRTTFYNLCPHGYSDERAIVMGRAKGTIDLDHYAESVGLTRLSEAVNHVWGLVSSARQDSDSPRPASRPGA